MRAMFAAAVALSLAAVLVNGVGFIPRAAASGEGCGRGGTTTKTGADDYEIRFCGPAVATLRIGKRTYIFRDGACFDANGKGILLYIGIEVIHSGELANVQDGKGPFLFLGLAKTLAEVTAYNGPHPLLVGSGGGAPARVSATGQKGRFSGRSLDPGKSVASGAHIAFAGTWACGGPVHSWQDFVAEVNRPVNG